MSERYYIPKEEEFYSGFEYECCKCLSKNKDKIVLDNIFIKYRFEVWDFLNYEDFYLDRCISDGMVRVKYLDENDFNSLGALSDKIRSCGGRMCFWKENYTFTYVINENKLQIIKHSPANEKCLDEKIFHGVIKNKSELRKLLIQLDIINS